MSKMFSFACICVLLFIADFTNFVVYSRHTRDELTSSHEARGYLDFEFKTTKENYMTSDLAKTVGDESRSDSVGGPRLRRSRTELYDSLQSKSTQFFSQVSDSVKDKINKAKSVTGLIHSALKDKIGNIVSRRQGANSRGQEAPQQGDRRTSENNPPVNTTDGNDENGVARAKDTKPRKEQIPTNASNIENYDDLEKRNQSATKIGGDVSVEDHSQRNESSKGKEHVRPSVMPEGKRVDGSEQDADGRRCEETTTEITSHSAGSPRLQEKGTLAQANPTETFFFQGDVLSENTTKGRDLNETVHKEIATSGNDSNHLSNLEVAENAKINSFRAKNVDNENATLPSNLGHLHGTLPSEHEGIGLPTENATGGESTPADGNMNAVLNIEHESANLKTELNSGNQYATPQSEFERKADFHFPTEKTAVDEIRFSRDKNEDARDETRTKLEQSEPGSEHLVQEMSSIFPSNDESTRGPDSIKKNSNHIWFESNSIICSYSNADSEKVEDRSLKCNETECRLEQNSGKASLWLCGDIKCNVANLDFGQGDFSEKKVLECQAKGRNLIEAPLKCGPGEKLFDSQCRKVYGA